jgi:hypothetical protein
LVAFASGDLPGALRHLDDAARRYADLGIRVPPGSSPGRAAVAGQAAAAGWSFIALGG